MYNLQVLEKKKKTTKPFSCTNEKQQKQTDHSLVFRQEGKWKQFIIIIKKKNHKKSKTLTSRLQKENKEILLREQKE